MIVLSMSEIINLYLLPIQEKIPKFSGIGFLKIKPPHINENGVFRLLDRIDVSKSSGSDRLPVRLLQCLAKIVLTSYK